MQRILLHAAEKEHIMKFILVPDSFKGTVSEPEVCRIMGEALRRHIPRCRTISFPVADGGEGTVDCFVEAMQGERRELETSGPFFEKVAAFYGVVTGADGKKTGVIEMAAAAGLPLAEKAPGGRDPLRATTYGVGELMLAAAREGCEKLIVGLGGSATNDGGCGAAAAAGVKFYDGDGREFVPAGGTLGEIARIDVSGVDAALKNIEIVAMCDVDNPLHGKTGASYVYAPQKGADAAAVEQLDRGLAAFDGILSRELGVSIGDVPGAGAAGGMGVGMIAFFGAKLVSGITVVLDAVGFDRELDGADMVFTGEGRIDGQSVRGKVISGVAQRAAAKGVPVAVVAGDAGDGVEAAYDLGVTAIFSTNRVARPFSEIKHLSAANLAFAMDNIARVIACFGEKKESMELPEIETPRLLLRRFRPEDRIGLFEILSDERTTLDGCGFHAFKAMDGDYELMMERFAEQNRYCVVLRETGRITGTVVLTKEERAVPAYELGFMAAPSQQRKGYMYEALSALIDEFFASGRAEMFTACCFDYNRASGELIRKLGFTYEGIERCETLHEERGAVDLVCYSRLKGE